MVGTAAPHQPFWAHATYIFKHHCWHREYYLNCVPCLSHRSKCWSLWFTCKFLIFFLTITSFKIDVRLQQWHLCPVEELFEWHHQLPFTCPPSYSTIGWLLVSFKVISNDNSDINIWWKNFLDDITSSPAHVWGQHCDEATLDENYTL